LGYSGPAIKIVFTLNVKIREQSNCPGIHSGYWVQVNLAGAGQIFSPLQQCIFSSQSPLLAMPIRTASSIRITPKWKGPVRLRFKPSSKFQGGHCDQACLKNREDAALKCEPAEIRFQSWLQNLMNSFFWHGFRGAVFGFNQLVISRSFTLFTQGAKGSSYARIRDISRTEAQSSRRLATAGCLGFGFCVSPLLRTLRQHSKTRLFSPFLSRNWKGSSAGIFELWFQSKAVSTTKLAW